MHTAETMVERRFRTTPTKQISFTLQAMPAMVAHPQPDSVIVAAGAQIMDSQTKALRAQRPGLPTPVASFNVTQLGNKPDKVGKGDSAASPSSTTLSITRRAVVAMV